MYMDFLVQFFNVNTQSLDYVPTYVLINELNLYMYIAVLHAVCIVVSTWLLQKASN